MQHSPAQPPVPAPMPSDSNDAPPKAKPTPKSKQKAKSNAKPPPKPNAQTPSKPPGIPRSLSQLSDSPGWQSQFESPTRTEGRRLTRSSSAKARSSSAAGSSSPPGPFGHIAKGPPIDHAKAPFFRTPTQAPAPDTQSPQTQAPASAPSVCAHLTACLSPAPTVNTTGSGDSDETIIGPHPDDLNTKPAADSDFSKTKHE